MNLDIYVPTGPGCEQIAPASGIVGRPEGPGQVLCYYEGNLYGSESMRHFRERLMHAAGRMVQRYPTTARICLPESALRPVGVYDAARWTVASVSDPDALAAWAGEPIAAITGHRFAPGPLDVADPAVQETLRQLRPISRHTIRSLWRSIAGQTIEHRPDRTHPFAVLEEA